MLEFLWTFFVYLIAFALGSLIALLVTKYVYPATSERDALAEIGDLTGSGAAR